MGELTVSGTGEHADLNGICQWATTRMGFANFTNTAARSPSPAVNYWAESQMTVPAFLAELAAYNTHLFFIDRSADALVLADMFIPNGARSLYFRKNQIFKREYQPASSNPTARITANWTAREFKNESIGKYVKDVEKEVSVSMDRACSGTATATTSGKLVDAGASFLSLVKIGMTVRNRTTDTSAVVTAVDGDTTLSLDADIMTSGESYEVGFEFPYGQELSVTPFDDETSRIREALVNIMNIIHRPGCQLEMELNEDFPVPGEAISLVDTYLENPSDITLHAHSIALNFTIGKERVRVFGLGSFEAS